MFEQLFRALDVRAALDLRVWEFSWRSLSQTYGRTVLRHVAARHPIRTMAGLQAYRRWVRSGHGAGPVSPVGAKPAEIAASAGLLVGLGFCQKPVQCPAGRFSPDCRVFGAPRRPAALLPVCAGCPVRAIGERALAADAALYLMTSAQRIASDLFLPALGGPGFRHAILALCPLSVQPMALMFHICRIRGLLLAYGQGACDTYARWLAADGGDKPEITGLAPEADDVLDRALAAAGQWASGSTRWYRRRGNIFVPAG